MKKLFLLILAVVFMLSSCSFLPESQQDKSTENQKFIATWVTYKEIQKLCNQSKSEEELINNINNVLITLKKYKVNNIFLHARAFDDCFYSSSIFNVSDYCKDENGNLKFDILKYFIEIAEDYSINIHAWINPYRIRNDNQTDKIMPDSFAGEILGKNIDDERIIVTENSIYYNPAYHEIQNYVLSGIREILENYNVSGIHIDDYFYPTTDEEIDKKIFNNYIKHGGTLNRADFRRNAVNSLVSSIYSLVKSYDSNILVSISPSADIEKNYSNSYADIRLWAQNDGYADILIPQLYYGFNHSTMPFDKLLNEWIALDNDNTKIVPGLAVYKSGCEDVYAQNGKNEWLKNDNVIAQQIYNINNENGYGWSYFSASYLFENMGEKVETEKNNIILCLDSIWNNYAT